MNPFALSLSFAGEHTRTVLEVVWSSRGWMYVERAEIRSAAVTDMMRPRKVL